MAISTVSRTGTISASIAIDKQVLYSTHTRGNTGAVANRRHRFVAQGEAHEHVVKGVLQYPGIEWRYSAVTTNSASVSLSFRFQFRTMGSE